MNLRYLLLALALPACHSADKPANHSQTPAADARFDALKTRFLDELWPLNPDFAATQGLHKYDSLLVVPDAAQRQRDAAFATRYQTALRGIFPDSLSPNNQTDYRMLAAQLRSFRWYADTLKDWQWNPAAYNLGASVGDLLNGRHYRLDRRLRNISDKLAGAPAYYAAAQANLKNPTPEHVALAVLQNEGGLSVFSTLQDSLNRSGLAAGEKLALTQRIAAAQAAVKGYVAF